MSTPAAGRLQDRLSRFGTRLGGSTLKAGTGGFLSWWGNALASWLPPRVRQLLGMDRGRLLLVVEGEVLRLRLQRGDEIRDLGNVPVLQGFEAPHDPLARVLDVRLSDLAPRALLRAGSRLGTTLQVPEDMWHQDFAAFETYWAEGLQRVRIDPPVRDYLMKILDHDILPFPLNKVFGLPGRWVNVGFLPPEIREEMGLSWSEQDERRHARLMRLLGRLNEPLPRILRMFPLNAMMWNLRLRHRFGKPLV